MQKLRLEEKKQTILVPPKVSVEWPQDMHPPPPKDEKDDRTGLSEKKRSRMIRPYVRGRKKGGKNTRPRHRLTLSATSKKSPRGATKQQLTDTGSGLFGVLRSKQASIASKEREVASLEEKLRSAKAADKLGELPELTKKWKKAIRRALTEIQSHPSAPRKPDGGQFTIPEILTAIGLAPESVGFNVEEDRFLEDDGDDE